MSRQDPRISAAWIGGLCGIVGAVAAALIGGTIAYRVGYDDGYAAASVPATAWTNTVSGGESQSAEQPPSQGSEEQQVDLADLWVVDSGNYQHDKNPFTDLFGNQYLSSFSFSWETAFAIFSVQDGYTSFSADVVAGPPAWACQSYSVLIVLDDSSTPKESIRNFTMTTGTVHISADISGAITMKILTQNEEMSDDCYGDVRLVDAYVIK